MVKIVEGMGAMMVIIGYLIMGADDGQSSGDPDHLDLFDPAKLHANVPSTYRVCLG